MAVQGARVPDGAKREVERRAGVQLCNLMVSRFRVPLDVSGGRTVRVDIIKPFRLRLDDEPWRDCDPTARPEGGVTGDTDFIRLVGRTCDDAVLSEERPLLALSGGGALHVDLPADDFEPIHLRGDGPGAHDFFWDLG